MRFAVIIAAANGIFLVSALCYLYSWLVTDKLSRGCKLTNVEAWANVFNVVPSVLYIFSSLGTAWFHFTEAPAVPRRALAGAAAAPAWGAILNSSAELKLLSGLNVFADVLFVVGAVFYFATWFRDTRAVARECAAAEATAAGADASRGAAAPPQGARAARWSSRCHCLCRRRRCRRCRRPVGCG